MGGGNLVDPLKHRIRIGNILEREVAMEGGRIHLPGNPAKLQQRLDLRTEGEGLGGLRPINRLDSEMIPGPEQQILPPVPDDKSEHPPQKPRTFKARLFVKVENRFRVRIRFEAVPLMFQRSPQLPIIVDLPVENDPNLSGLVGKGLISLFQVDDAQPAKPQT